MQSSDSNTNYSRERSVGAAFFWTGLLLLAIGFFAGVFGSRYYWQKKSLADFRNANEVRAVSATDQTQATPSVQPWLVQSRLNQFLPAIAGMPGYSLTLDVRDLKDHYQVSAFLPKDTKPEECKVNLTGDQLKVDVANKVEEKPTKKDHETALTEWGNYEQVLSLAGPLKDNQMTVKRLPHELIITVPKAAPQA